MMICHIDVSLIKDLLGKSRDAKNSVLSSTQSNLSMCKNVFRLIMKWPASALVSLELYNYIKDKVKHWIVFIHVFLRHQLSDHVLDLSNWTWPGRVCVSSERNRWQRTRLSILHIYRSQRCRLNAQWLGIYFLIE